MSSGNDWYDKKESAPVDNIMKALLYSEDMPWETIWSVYDTNKSGKLEKENVALLLTHVIEAVRYRANYEELSRKVVSQAKLDPSAQATIFEVFQDIFDELNKKKDATLDAVIKACDPEAKDGNVSKDAFLKNFPAVLGDLLKDIDSTAQDRLRLAVATVRKQQNEQHVSRLKVLFDKVDRDGSGSIEAREVTDLIRKWYRPPRIQVLQVLAQFDTDYDNKVTLQEFMDRYTKVKSKTPGEDDILLDVSDEMRAELKTGFEELDVNKDGSLSLRELVPLVQDAYRPPEVVRSRFVQLADANSDGKISFEEIVASLNELSVKYQAIFQQESKTAVSNEVPETVFNYHSKRLRQLFDEADKDKSGALEGSELTSLVRRWYRPSQRQVSVALKRFDTNFNKSISLQEFIAGYTTCRSLDPNVPDIQLEVDEDIIAELKQGFAALDTDNSGTLSIAELVPLLQDSYRPPKAVVEAFAAIVDKNDDKKITFSELDSALKELAAKQPQIFNAQANNVRRGSVSDEKTRDEKN